MPLSVVCDKCPEIICQYSRGGKRKQVHDVTYRRYGDHGWVASLTDGKGNVHRLGLILGSAKDYDGYWAVPVSRQRKRDADPCDSTDAAYTGNPTVKGLKSRRHAVQYLLRAEGFWTWDS